MFKHLLKYEAKIFFFNRDGVAFGIIFPLIYGIIYLFAFQGLVQIEDSFDRVPVAVVQEAGSESSTFMENIDSIAAPAELEGEEWQSVIERENTFFLYYLTDATGADQLVEAGLLGHVLYVNGEDLSLSVAPEAVNDISSTIVYMALDTFSSYQTTIQSLYADAVESPNPNEMIETIEEKIASLGQTTYVMDANAEEGVSGFSNFFYASLAYLCIFFMSVGISIVTENEADYSWSALLTTASPVPKSKRFLATFTISVLSSLTIIYALLYIFHLNDIPLGNDPIRLVALMTLGVFVGILLGTAIASVLKARTNILTGISIALPLALGALSGLVNLNIKSFLMQRVPWLAKVNPVALINDGIYYLNNYPTYTQYNQNMMILSIFAFVCLIITMVALRRTDYEHL